MSPFMLLTAALFPVNTFHGFTTRQGGVSQGRYASLNASSGWGDNPSNVQENRRRIAVALGFAASDLVEVKQIHCAVAVRARDVTASTQADAIWSHRDDPGKKIVAVRTADCVPVLLASADGAWIAAVHSGWRGSAADIVGNTVAALAKHGADPATLRAAIGPCIEASAFEVGEEVAQLFPGAFCHLGPRGRPHVDLVATIRRQLLHAGLSATAIERVGGCTYSHPETYFSYRRDGAGIGQHLALIGFRQR